MKRTLNEVYRLCQKAAEGAGAPAGLDIEAARNTAWLVARGISALDTLATQLEGGAGDDACGFTASHAAAPALDAAGRPGALLAPALVDLLVARSGKQRGRLIVTRLSAPVYLLPAAVAYRESDWGFRFILRDACARDFVLEANATGVRVMGQAGTTLSNLSSGAEFDVIAHCAFAGRALPETPSPDTLITYCDFAGAEARRRSSGIDVDPGPWQRLEKLAVNVLVPATEESRLRGAGSTATDNE